MDIKGLVWIFQVYIDTKHPCPMCTLKEYLVYVIISPVSTWLKTSLQGQRCEKNPKCVQPELIGGFCSLS